MIWKEDGQLDEAWFIDGLKQGLGRVILNERIYFMGEFFNAKVYRGMQELQDGDQYEGYLKGG